MKENYDFTKGVKNPYASKVKDGYTVTVHYNFTANDNNEEQMKKEDLPDCNNSRKQA